VSVHFFQKKHICSVAALYGRAKKDRRSSAGKHVMPAGVLPVRVRYKAYQR
jgi:hypothetical protein